MSNKAILLVIDPQVDFCDPNGSLFVKGADADMKRLATMVRENINLIERINITLDSHQYVHIAHPIFWINSKGEHPNPFTVITVEDVEKGVWKTTNPQMQQWGLDYVKTLRDNKRYVLCIWPYHCLIGSKGATVIPELFDAVCEWEKRFRKVNYVPKGSNIFTEHYSVVKADVTYSGDPTTMLNSTFINMLKSDSDILVAGEAFEFCVFSTLRDIIEEFTEEQVKKIVIVEDCTSPVNAVGSEHLKDDAYNYLKNKGVRFTKSTQYF